MKLQKYEKYLVPAILLAVIIVYSVLVFLSEGTHGGADDIGHYRRSRYAFRFPHFFLYHWGKPFFTDNNGVLTFSLFCVLKTRERN